MVSVNLDLSLRDSKFELKMVMFCDWFAQAIPPGVPKKTVHCLISCNVKSIKAISLK